MKKIIVSLFLLIGITFFNNILQAQGVNISVNVGRQPAWGPVGYDYVGYYYFPDINCYYDVNVETFYYPEHGRWISSRYLPYQYRERDLYGLYKVVINTREPWRYNRAHNRDYARYRGCRTQVIIRDSHDNRYRDSRHNDIRWYKNDRNTSRNHYANNYRGEYKNRNDYERYPNKDNGRYKNNNRSDDRKYQNREDKEYKKNDSPRQQYNNEQRGDRFRDKDRGHINRPDNKNNDRGFRTRENTRGRN